METLAWSKREEFHCTIYFSIQIVMVFLKKNSSCTTVDAFGMNGIYLKPGWAQEICSQ